MMNEYYEEALQAYARIDGTYFWKKSLRNAWMNGHYLPLGTDLVGRLQELSNMVAFGLRGLIKYRLPKKDKSQDKENE